MPNLEIELFVRMATGTWSFSQSGRATLSALLFLLVQSIGAYPSHRHHQERKQLRAPRLERRGDVCEGDVTISTAEDVERNRGLL